MSTFMRHGFDLRALATWVAAFGLSPDARIATPKGGRAAARLRVSDFVITRDDGPKRLTHVNQSIGAVAERNHFAVHFPQGAQPFGLPRADLLIEPEHPILFEHIRVPLKFIADAVLVGAKSLVISHRPITVSNKTAPNSYVQLGSEQQAIIFVEGLPVETVRPEGDCALDYMIIRSWALRAALG